MKKENFLNCYPFSTSGSLLPIMDLKWITDGGIPIEKTKIHYTSKTKISMKGESMSGFIRIRNMRSYHDWNGYKKESISAILYPYLKILPV